MAKCLTYTSFEEIQKDFPKKEDNNYTKTLEKNSKYNELTVLYKTFSSKGRCSQYVCQCSCGKYCVVTKTNLTKNLTKSCGHLRGHEAEDLTNQKFGKLTPLYIDKIKNNKAYWFCQCDCGGTTIVSAAHLKEHSIQSCGCIKSHGEDKIANILKENNINFIKQYSSSECIFPETNHRAFFDFAILKDNKLIYLIEYDGIQHFLYKNDNGWNNEKNFMALKKRDDFKNQWCKDNNIPLIRIPYIILNKLSINDLMLETSNYILKE